MRCAQHAADELGRERVAVGADLDGSEERYCACVADGAVEGECDRFRERHPAHAQDLLRVGIAPNALETPGDKADLSLVGYGPARHEVEKLKPVVGGKACFLRELAPRRVSEVLLGLAAARWKLPTVEVSPVPVLSDEIGAAGVVDGQDA